MTPEQFANMFSLHLISSVYGYWTHDWAEIWCRRIKPDGDTVYEKLGVADSKVVDGAELVACEDVIDPSVANMDAEICTLLQLRTFHESPYAVEPDASHTVVLLIKGMSTLDLIRDWTNLGYVNC